MSEYHRHAIEGGFIIHQAHDLGSGAAALDPIPFEGHRHLVVLMERNYVHEESGAATLDGAEVVMRCSNHRCDYDNGAPGCGIWLAAREGGGNPTPCFVTEALVIPLPDRETPAVDPDIAREAVETLINKPLRDPLPDKGTTALCPHGKTERHLTRELPTAIANESWCPGPLPDKETTDE